MGGHIVGHDVTLRILGRLGGDAGGKLNHAHSPDRAADLENTVASGAARLSSPSPRYAVLQLVRQDSSLTLFKPLTRK